MMVLNPLRMSMEELRWACPLVMMVKKHIERDLKKDNRNNECPKPVKLKYGEETSEEQCDDPPEEYVPDHICMNETVVYSGHGRIPTHGPHRPNWASFGEYSYCPMERYQHNLEHGTVVLLYHPCIVKKQIKTIKFLVASSAYKHIITPSDLPSQTKPIILIGWGCYMEFQFFDLEKMKEFITSVACKGPEGYLDKDGYYVHLQVAKAKKMSGSIVCEDLKEI